MKTAKSERTRELFYQSRSGGSYKRTLWPIQHRASNLGTNNNYLPSSTKNYTKPIEERIIRRIRGGKRKQKYIYEDTMNPRAAEDDNVVSLEVCKTNGRMDARENREEEGDYSRQAAEAAADSETPATN